MGETIQKFNLTVGQTILYSKFGIGATDLTVQGDLHVLIREDDVIGTLPRSGATAADVPDLHPAADRVLIKVTCHQWRHLHGIARSTRISATGHAHSNPSLLTPSDFPDRPRSCAATVAASEGANGGLLQIC